MPGSNYIGNAYNTLSGALGIPVPGATASGFDTLSSGYSGAEASGVSDISRRGLTQSGATPELYTNLGEQYGRGATQTVAAGQQAQDAQTQQILNALLGLAGPAASVAGAGIGKELTEAGAGGELATGLFGNVRPTLFNQGGGGLLSTGIYGNSQSLFSRLLGI